MLPLTHRRECVVKAHRNVADEQATGLGHIQANRRALYKPVGLERRERGEFAGKVFREVDAELLRHRGVVE